MIGDAEVERYVEQGYLVVEGVLRHAELTELREAIDEFVERAREVSENDELYDLEDTHSAAEPRVRRLKSPHEHHPAFRKLIAHPAVVAVLEKLWGVGVRFDKSKLNMKSPGYGSPVEWHQDWAFYPHTNDDLAAVGFMIDDMTLDNGPLLVVPGSHRGPVYSHHVAGRFCGAVDVVACRVDTSHAEALTGAAGSITVHHVRALHGSAPNRSHRPRRLLLHQYQAADAWPLLGVKDYEAFRGSLLSGEEVQRPRMKELPVVVPFPAAAYQGSIYENQRVFSNRFFDSSEPRSAPDDATGRTGSDVVHVPATARGS